MFSVYYGLTRKVTEKQVLNRKRTTARMHVIAAEFPTTGYCARPTSSYTEVTATAVCLLRVS